MPKPTDDVLTTEDIAINDYCDALLAAEEGQEVSPPANLDDDMVEFIQFLDGFRKSEAMFQDARTRIGQEVLLLAERIDWWERPAQYPSDQQGGGYVGPSRYGGSRERLVPCESCGRPFPAPTKMPRSNEPRLCDECEERQRRAHIDRPTKRL